MADRVLRRWNRKEVEEVAKLPEKSVSLSPQGKYVIIQDPPALHEIETQTTTPLEFSKLFFRVIWSPDERHFVFRTSKEIFLFEVGSVIPKKIDYNQPHADPSDVVFSANGSYFLFGLQDSHSSAYTELQKYTIETGKLESIAYHMTKPVAISAGGKMIAAGFNHIKNDHVFASESVILREGEDGVSYFDVLKESVSYFAFSPDNKFLVVVGEGSWNEKPNVFTIRDARTKGIVQAIYCPYGYSRVGDVKWGLDSRWVAFTCYSPCSKDHQICVW